ncbi:MAG: bifunctional phosphoglucose/phosphomannose isomerase [Actinobacteria bacterium]|nr:bifunctional phosphoglucose/phosphomannose isomerase [Actinomycetota bacterium]
MTADQNPLSRDDVLAVDAAALVDDILAMPDHIEDAIWRAESAMLRPSPSEALVICGMGGSAIGADLAVAALGETIDKPVCISRGYDLPSWVGPRHAAIFSSYSGNTEETLSCYEQATTRGVPAYVVSSGGMISEQAHSAGVPVIGLPGILQPRASVGYGVVSVLEIGIATGVVNAAVRADLAAASSLLRELVAEWGPDTPADALPKQMARDAQAGVTITYGAQLTAPVAYRWKCQINENAKLTAASAELPEANHNEINGWQNRALNPRVAWLLRDAGQHERVRARIELTAEAVAEAGAQTQIIDTRGASPLERLFSAVLLGDLVSLYMAVLAGVDPSPVPLIEGLKDRLGRPARA